MMSEEMIPLPPGTVLESDEEIDRVIAELKRRKVTTEPARQEPGHRSPAAVRVELPFRPSNRPPAAILTVCDDGETTGEVIRLRNERFIIGRTEGDLQLPNDEQISSRHVSLTRQIIANRIRWVVTDLQSRNGLFVRISKAPLAHKAEVLVGSGRYRFEVSQSAVAETTDEIRLENNGVSTRAFDNQLPDGAETLTEILHGGIGPRILLVRDQYWIGSAAECEICRATDPFVRDRHAKLSRSPKGTWVIQNQQAINGVWLRMPQITVDAGTKCDFQIGEQRLKLAFSV